MFFDTSTDIFIISSMGGNIVAGLYGMVVNIGMMLYRWSPLMVMIDIVRPIFFRRYARLNTDDSLKEMFNSIVKAQLAGVIPIFFGFIILGNKFIALFFPRYKVIYLFLIVFVIFTIIKGVKTALEMVIYAKQRVSIILESKIFSLYNLFADILFFSFWGIIGVVLATASAELFRCLYLSFRLRNTLKLNLPLASIFTVFINSGLMAIVIYLLRNFATGYLSFFGIVVLGILIYLVALYFNSPFSKKERNFFKSLLPKVG